MAVLFVNTVPGGGSLSGGCSEPLPVHLAPVTGGAPPDPASLGSVSSNSVLSCPVLVLNAPRFRADEEGVRTTQQAVADESGNEGDATRPSALEAALRPPTPGRLVRFLAPIAPGIRTTREQIAEYAEHWRTESERALSADGGDGIIVVLGDSLSQGVGCSDIHHSWVHRLARHEAQQRRLRPAPVVNLSRSGATIEDVLGVQLPALREIERPIRLLTCTIGSNDLARGRSYSKVEASMHSLMSRLPSDALLATLPAKGSIMAKRLNRTIRQEAARSGLVVADVDAHLPGWRGRSAGDRFHPNDLGYESWFDAFAEAVPPRSTRRDGVGPNPTPER